MRGVWIVVDDKPIALVAGRSIWTIFTSFGPVQFTRKDSNHGYLLAWARDRYEGQKHEIKWADAELPLKMKIEDIIRQVSR